MSETVITWVSEVVFPFSSVTCQIIVLIPKPILPPLEAIVYDGVKEVEQLSVAVAICAPKSIIQVLVTISVGITKTGFSLSSTVTN